MDIKVISDTVLLRSKRDVVKTHLYTKMLQHGILPIEKDLNIIAELYVFGGYNNAQEQKDFINLCVSRKYRESEQSLRNILSYYTIRGVLTKPKNRMLYVSDKFMQGVKCDKLVLTPKVSHAE